MAIVKSEEFNKNEKEATKEAVKKFLEQNYTE